MQTNPQANFQSNRVIILITIINTSSPRTDQRKCQRIDGCSVPVRATSLAQSCAVADIADAWQVHGRVHLGSYGNMETVVKLEIS